MSSEPVSEAELVFARATFLERVERHAPHVLRDLAGDPLKELRRFLEGASGLTRAEFSRPGLIYENVAVILEGQAGFLAFAAALARALEAHNIDARWVRDQALDSLCLWIEEPAIAGKSWGELPRIAVHRTRDDLYDFKPEPIVGWNRLAWNEGRDNFRAQALKELERQVTAYMDRFEAFLAEEGLALPLTTSTTGRNIEWFVLYQTCGVDVRELQVLMHKSKATVNQALNAASTLLDIPRAKRDSGRPSKKV